MRSTFRTALPTLALAFLAGCGVGVEALMPTPVVYTEAGLHPLAHIPAHDRWLPRRIYYATNRARTTDAQRIDYGNSMSDTVAVGAALIGFGDEDMTWATLDRASTSAERDFDVHLSIAGIMEYGRFPLDTPHHAATDANEAGTLIADLRDAISDARDKDLLIYVHGAKVNFYNACAFAAELDHFMGRDMTALAFAWPTHQDIFAYVSGEDVRRAYTSADVLATLIEMLAAETPARRIHVLAWSAGSRVTATALARLRARHAGLDDETARARFRLGTVYFAAGDVPTREFVEEAPAIHSLVEEMVITQSSHDEALDVGRAVMGGGDRIGQEHATLDGHPLQELLDLERLEIIDVSIGSKQRGFDITGHDYWFRHPWASSDALLSIRTRLGPAERGLVRGEGAHLWYLPHDYPERLKRLLEQSELRTWIDHGDE